MSACIYSQSHASDGIIKGVDKVRNKAQIFWKTLFHYCKVYHNVYCPEICTLLLLNWINSLPIL